MALGERIKNARKAKHLSQEELAKQLFISRSALAKWETGQSMPDIRMLKKLSVILEVSMDHLTAEEPSLTAPTVPKPLYEQPLPKSPSVSAATDPAERQLLYRVFAAMLLILLNNQYVNWFHSSRMLPLEYVPAFIGYFILLPIVPNLLPGYRRIFLQSLLAAGGLAALGGFFSLLGGDKTGAFPILNLLGHMAAVTVLFLFAVKRRRQRGCSIGVFWPVCIALMLLMDVWLVLFCGFDLQHIFLYNGANLRLLPAAAMLIELWGLHPEKDTTFEDSVF